MRLPRMRTHRMLLRTWTREDVDALHALWTEPEVRRYLWDDVVITRDTAQQMIDSHLMTVASSISANFARRSDCGLLRFPG